MWFFIFRHWSPEEYIPHSSRQPSQSMRSESHKMITFVRLPSQIHHMQQICACAKGVRASFVNQPIEVPSLRAALGEILGRTDFPHVVLRLGYGQEVAPTPGRSVSEVLLTDRKQTH